MPASIYVYVKNAPMNFTLNLKIEKIFAQSNDLLTSFKLERETKCEFMSL